jgi:plasmid stabilization system protein ParE
MPQITYVQNALENLGEIAEFWRENPTIGRRAIQEIRERIKKLKTLPNIGKPSPDDAGKTRLLTVPFGSSGYVVRYCFDPTLDTVFILAVRNFRQAGFIE